MYMYAIVMNKLTTECMYVRVYVYNKYVYICASVGVDHLDDSVVWHVSIVYVDTCVCIQHVCIHQTSVCVDHILMMHLCGM